MAHAYATTAQLALRLGQTVDAARATQAIEEASAVVDAYVGYDLDPGTASVLIIRRQSGAPGAFVYLPHRYTSVTAVTVDGVALVSPGGWTFDLPPHRLTLTAGWGREVAVTGGVGYADADMPPLVRSIVLSVAARTLANPAGGIRSESLSDHAVTFAGDDPTGGAYLTAVEEALLAQSGLLDLGFA